VELTKHEELPGRLVADEAAVLVNLALRIRILRRIRGRVADFDESIRQHEAAFAPRRALAWLTAIPGCPEPA